MKAAAAAQEYEQAALERNRLRAVRSLLERQRVANEAVGTLDAIARRRRRDRRQRAGLPGPRRRALRPPVVLPRERRRARASGEVAEEFIAAVLRATARRSRRRSSSRQERRRTREALGEALAERRGGRGRGPRRRARRQAPHPRARRAQRAARARPGAPEGRAPPPAARRGARRAAGGARARRAAAADRVLRHLEPDGHAHGRLDGRLRGRRAEEVRLPALQRSARCRRACPTTSPRWREVLGAPAARSGRRQQDLQPARPRAQRVVRHAAEPDRHRRRQGPARGRPERAARASASAASRSSRSPSASRRSSCPAAASRSCSRTTRPRCSCCSACATRRTASRSPTTARAATSAMTASVLDDLPGDRPGAQARAARALRLARGGPRRHARAARGGARAAGEDRARHLHAPASDGGLTPSRGVHCNVRRARETAGHGREAHRGATACASGAAVATRAAGARRETPRPYAETRLEDLVVITGLLGRRQVDGDGRLRGRGLLLRRQPAAGDDPRARRAVRARGLEGRARGRRLRRARRRLLRGAARGARRPRRRWGCATACSSSTPTDEALLTRYKETRRRHPLARSVAASSGASPPSARCSSRIKGLADVVIDSTGLKAAHAAPPDRRRAPARACRRPSSPSRSESFGFKHGPARDADIVLDVRFLPNPHYEPELRPLTGHDQRDRRLRRPRRPARRLLRAPASRCWTTCCPQYVAEGKAHLTIADRLHRRAPPLRGRSPSTSRAAGASATTSSSRSPTATSRRPTAATATAAPPEPAR